MADDRGQMTEGRGQKLGDRGRWNFEFRPGNFRRGVTLMEVLISIAVVAVGLLGVASLIPIGTFAVTETAKSDRSAALGRAAMHEVRVRGMLEPRNDRGTSRWCFGLSGEQALDQQYPPGTGPYWPHYSPYLIGQAFAIDPLYATEAASQKSDGNYNTFPYSRLGIWSSGDDSRLARLRLDNFDSAYGIAPSYSSLSIDNKALVSQPQLAVFNRIFTWPDDLVFDIDEDNPDLRPRQSFFWNNGTTGVVAPFPLRGSEVAPGTCLGANVSGYFTWMLTAEPDVSELPVDATLDQLQNHKQKTYTVSIVTFYRRNVSCDITVAVPNERLVEISFSGSTGIGGGDAVLTAPSSDQLDQLMTQETAEEYLKVKEGEWIMVTGFVADTRLSPVTILNSRRNIAKWYKVIRVDDEVQVTGTSFTRNVTLAGPDWNNTIIVPNSARATIIDGAIGVYTTTVTVE